MRSWIKNNYKIIIICALILPPILVSIISTIHVVSFFGLSNSKLLSIIIAIAFEVGSLSSLAALAIMDKINKTSLWIIFILLTSIQSIGNTYYSYNYISTKMETNDKWIKNWVELVNFMDEDIVYTKRVLSIISGAILPLISLGFTHFLVDYVKKMKTDDTKVLLKREEDDEELILEEEGVEEEVNPEEPNNFINEVINKPPKEKTKRSLIGPIETFRRHRF